MNAPARRPPRPGRFGAGVTLVEIMIASAILVTVIAVCFAVLMSSQDVQVQGEMDTAMEAAARAALDEMAKELEEASSVFVDTTWRSKTSLATFEMRNHFLVDLTGLSTGLGEANRQCPNTACTWAQKTGPTDLRLPQAFMCHDWSRSNNVNPGTLVRHGRFWSNTSDQTWTNCPYCGQLLGTTTASLDLLRFLSARDSDKIGANSFRGNFITDYGLNKAADFQTMVFYAPAWDDVSKVFNLRRYEVSLTDFWNTIPAGPSVPVHQIFPPDLTAPDPSIILPETANAAPWTGTPNPLYLPRGAEYAAIPVNTCTNSIELGTFASPTSWAIDDIAGGVLVNPALSDQFPYRFHNPENVPTWLDLLDFDNDGDIDTDPASGECTTETFELSPTAIIWKKNAPTDSKFFTLTIDLATGRTDMTVDISDGTGRFRASCSYTRAGIPGKLEWVPYRVIAPRITGFDASTFTSNPLDPSGDGSNFNPTGVPTSMPGAVRLSVLFDRRVYIRGKEQHPEAAVSMTVVPRN